jgi:hypothetical protein
MVLAGMKILRERPRGSAGRWARVARIRARVRARRYTLDAHATARALIEASAPRDTGSDSTAHAGPLR